MRNDKTRKSPMWMQDYVEYIAITEQLLITSAIISPPTFPYIVSQFLTDTYISF